MRARYLALPLALLAVAPPALAATAKTRATPRVSGGTIAVTASKPSHGRIRVRIRLSVTVKRSTRINFAAFPCRDAGCSQIGGGQRVRPGRQTLRFSGTVPVVRDVGKRGKPLSRACVFGQASDDGLATARHAYPLKTRSGRYGLIVCVPLA